MKNINIGIIGCGVIGRIHAKYAQPLEGCTVAAVCDLQEDLAREVAEANGVARYTTQPRELLEDPEIDGIVLAIPAAYRFQLGLDMLAAGKHLLTEKPVAMNAGQVEELIRARGDLSAGCCSCRLSGYETNAAAREQINSGAIGKIRVVHCRAMVPAGSPPKNPPPPWRLKKSQNGGGILMNWGVYDLDFLFSMLDWNVEPTTVLAQTFLMPPGLEAHQAPGSDAETHAVLMARFADGSVLHYERAERATVAKSMSWQVVGDRGSIRIDLLDPKAPVYLDRIVPEQGLVSEVIFHLPESTAQQHETPIRDFAEAIREGRQPRTSLERALIMQRLMDAAYVSAESGNAVQI